ncbi:MAG TPA: YoaK family protein [Sphingobium sp.]|uniref:YoaK family protein n=1 Tax=Sphingobium sp. TaxID=1912891 RepID=UPI002ED346BD
MDKTASQKPLVWLLLLLSMTTGLVDAASVLGLGKVFTANMTGNIVFLGFAAAGTPGFHAMSYAVAIFCFLGGALLAGHIGKQHEGRPTRRWLVTVASIEAVLLWGAAGLALRFDVVTQAPEACLYAIIGLTGVAMGLRNGTIRQLKVPDLTTTVLTLTLTGLAADSRLAGGGDPNWGRRIGSVAAIFAGATLGAALLAHGGLSLPLFIAGALALGGTVACGAVPAALGKGR